MQPSAIIPKPGERRVIRALADDVALPADTVTWSLSDADVVHVEAGQAVAGFKTGTAKLVGNYGALKERSRIRARSVHFSLPTKGLCLNNMDP